MRLHLPVSLFRSLLTCFAAVAATTHGSLSIASAADITYPNGSITYTKRQTSALTLKGYESISFSYISSSSSYGGAISNSGSNATFTLSGNGDVTFSGNSAYRNGGAIDNSDTFTLSDNGDVTFSGNTASSDGGAIYNREGTFTLSDNGDVTFSGNTASYGGAIYNRGTFTLSDNGNVTFSGNSASASYSSYGGAIYNLGTFSLSGNGDVTFSGNSASSSNYYSYGGAIDNSGTFTLSGNGEVLFEKNAEICEGIYRLRSIYSTGTLNLSASAGKSILFRDSVYAEGTVNLNLGGTGDIIFTGATTETDLRDVKGGIDGTASEILNSRTSELATLTNLYGGRLIVENGAVLEGQGITAAVDSGATVRVNNGTLNHSGYALTFNAGTTFEAEGANTVIVSSVNMCSGSTLSFVVGEENLTAAAMTLTGTLQTGSINLSIGGSYDLEAGHAYALLTASNYDTAAWTVENITLTTSDLRFDALKWRGGTLFLTVNPYPLGHFTFTSRLTGSQTLDGYESILFKDISSSSSGGAIYNWGTFTLSGNGDVTFSGNTASSSYYSSSGGAIHNSERNASFTLSDNGDVTFSGNSASSSSSNYSYGGAIYNWVTFTLSDNGDVTFSGNSASASASYGGAIYNSGTFTLSDNGDVTFSGNSASASYSSYGGAIYNSGTFTLSGNGEVLFEKNAEICEGIYRLRSIYSTGTLNLSASAGKSILFRDSVYAAGTVNLNPDGTGDIIFTGATTETDLRDVKGGADGTSDEIADSRTSEIATNATLYGGRLIVEDGAVLKGLGITAAADSGASVRVNNGTLNHSGYALTFNAGTTFEAEGANTVIASSVNMCSGSTLSFVVGEENLTAAAMTLTGTLQTGSINLSIGGSYDLEAGHAYALLTVSEYDPSAWTAENITLTTSDLSFDALKWRGGTLFLTVNPYPHGLFTFTSRLTGSQTLEGYESILFKNISSSSSYSSYGGAICNGGTFTLNDNGDVTFSGNSAFSSSAFSRGGAIYNEGTFTLSGNGAVTFSGNSAFCSDFSFGGAIYNEGTFTLSGNGAVTFSGNSASYGGAISSNRGTFKLSDNGDVMFSGNSASSCGGAIYTNIGGFDLSDNETVTFRGNEAGLGGAICAVSSGTFTLSGNQCLSFVSNVAKELIEVASAKDGNYVSASGGAIYGSPVIEHNNAVEITDNVSYASAHSSVYAVSASASGGAISGAVTFIGNGSVRIVNNTAEAQAQSDYKGASVSAEGGALRGSSSFIGNESVVFRNNAEVTHCISNGAEQVDRYRLRSIYDSGSTQLSAAEGKDICFYDSVYAGTLIVNMQEENDLSPWQGDIILSGEYVATDLAARKSADGAGEVTAQELSDSLTSYAGQTLLFGGQLLLQQGVTLTGSSLMVTEKSAARVELDNSSIQYGYDSSLTFHAGTTLSVKGISSVNATKLDMRGGSILSFTLSDEHIRTAALTLTGTLNLGGLLTLDLGDVRALAGAGEEYKLMALSSAVPSTWTTNNITLSATGATLADLHWVGNTLYLFQKEPAAALTWTGANDGVWGASSVNWKDVDRAYAYSDALPILFTDAGAGAVSIQGSLTPQSVTVDNSLGHDYIWQGSGSLTGSMTLTKRGEGTLTVTTRQAFSGGTVIEAGKVVVTHEAALGSGTVLLKGGTLEIAVNQFGNWVESSGNSSLIVAEDSCWRFTQTIINSGTLTLRGSFAADNLTLRHVAATRVDVNGVSGTSGFAKDEVYAVTLVNGGTTVNGGAVVTHGTHTLVLGADGVATEGGAVNYGTYLLVNGASAATSAIHGFNSAATVSMSGGTLTVDDAAVVNATGGSLSLNGGALSGTLNNVTLMAASGAVSASFSGTNTLIGNRFAPGSVLSNTGTLVMSGEFDVSALSLQTTDATHIDVNGNSGASGFAKDAAYAVTLAEGGSTVNGGATIKHGTRTLTLGTDGVARSGGAVNYGTYLLTGNDAASTSAIHAKGASATVSMNGGTLTVNDTATVNATGGTVVLSSGALKGSLANVAVTAASGALQAGMSGYTTLTGQHYALSSVLSNTGTLVMSGQFNASALMLNTTAATHVDVNGNSGASGFAKEAVYSVKLVNGGTVVNSGATVTHGTRTLELGSDGSATAGGAVDYATYLLTGTATASTGAIHAKAAGAAVSMSGGTLTVNDAATVHGTAGTIALSSGTLDGSLNDVTVNAAGGTLAADMRGGKLAVNGNVNLAGYAHTSIELNSGRLTAAETLELENGQSLSFKGGRLTGDVLTGTGSTLTLGSNATLNGDLTLDGGQLALNGNTLAVAGALNLVSTTSVDISSYAIGTYKLLTFGALEGRLDNLVLSGSRYRTSVSEENGALTLKVKALNNNLTWNLPKGTWSNLGAFGTGVFRADDDVNFRSAGNVTISGTVTPGSVLVNTPGNVVLVADKKVYGSGISGEGGVTKSGAGMLTMNAGNTYSGGTTLNAGTLKATAVDSFGTGAIIVNGGTLDLASKAVTNDIVLSGTATLKGDAKYMGNVTVDGKATLLAKTSYKGTTTIGEDSSLTLGAAATMAGNVALEGGTLIINNAKGMTLAKNQSMMLDGGEVRGLVTVGAGGTLAWQEGTMQNAPVLKGGTLDLGGKNALTLTGVKAQVRFGDKVIDLPGKGVVRSDETLNVLSGTVKLTAGAEHAAVKVSGNAALVNGATHSGDITVDGTLAKGTTIKLIDSHQTVNMNGAGITAAAISGIGTVNVNLSAGESIDATAAKLTAANISLNGGTFTNTKGIKLVKGQTLTLNGANVNLGAKGILTTAAGSTLKVSESATLSGSLTLGGGDLVFEGAALTVKGTLTLSKPVSVTGSGTLICDSVKPFKGDLGTLFGGADVKLDGTTLTINGGATKKSLVAAPVAEEEAPLVATPALPTLPEMPATNPVADAIAQADWGILDANRAFTGAVATRHQHAALLDKGRGAAWVNAFGASVRHGNQGAHHGSDGNIEGAALGMEHSVSETGVLGLAVGRSKNRIGATGVTHLRQQTAHVALYGQKQFKHNLTADATAAWGDTETKLGGSSWQQKSAALSGRLTHAHMVNDATAVRTFGGLSYEATESGSFGAAERSGSVQNLRAELGAGATHTAGKAHFYGEASLTGDLIRHNPSVELGGIRHHGATPGRLGVKGTFGAFYSFTDTWTGTASYSIEAESRTTSHTLNVGVSKQF